MLAEFELVGFEILAALRTDEGVATHVVVDATMSLISAPKINCISK